MFPLRDTIPSRRFPLATILLVGLNVAVFVHELRLGDGLEAFVQRFGLVPRGVPLEVSAFLADPRAYRGFLTSMFLHGGWLHVIGNLWMLWIFGDNVEDRMGRLRFLAFYTLCGLLAGGVHVYFHPASAVPTIGASGAVSGVMGAYFLLYPRARVVTLIPLLFYPVFAELPAFVFLGLWFLMQLLESSAALDPAVGGVAFLAHVGGFLAGAGLFWVFLRPRERR
jgi:membrane associated rhomboid family serine protease